MGGGGRGSGRGGAAARGLKRACTYTHIYACTHTEHTHTHLPSNLPGAGKSSVLAALLRLTPIAGGRILVMGADAASTPLPALRRQFAVVPQAPLLFSGTLRDNLDPMGEHRGQDEDLGMALEVSGRPLRGPAPVRRPQRRRRAWPAEGVWDEGLGMALEVGGGRRASARRRRPSGRAPFPCPCRARPAPPRPLVHRHPLFPPTATTQPFNRSTN